MAYFYVKHDGTATGDNGRYASIQSSSFATLGTSGYYSDIYDAINTPTTPPTSGDHIFCSDLHSQSADFGGNILIPDGAKLISVDDANGSLYKPGATESEISIPGYDYVFFGSGAEHFIAGMDLGTKDNVLVGNGPETTLKLQDCILRSDLSGDVAINNDNQDGVKYYLINCDLIANTAAAGAFIVANGGILEMIGGSIQTHTSLFLVFGTQGGASAKFVGVDLSSCTTLIPSVVSSRDNIVLTLQNCTLNSGVTLPTGFGKDGQRFEMYNCDDTAGTYHRFYISDYAGIAKNNDATYVTATESWYEGSAKSSIEVITTANCSHATPFIFELPAQYINLANISSDVITVDLITTHATTAITLTDTDIAAFLVYPDGTTAVTPLWVTSGLTATGYLGIDPLAAGTELTASGLGAGDWTGELSSTNFYQMSLDTTGAAGQAGTFKIRIEVYKASITAGQLFIDSEVTVS